VVSYCAKHCCILAGSLKKSAKSKKDARSVDHPAPIGGGRLKNDASQDNIKIENKYVVAI
jgi:hypothetical protein